MPESSWERWHYVAVFGALLTAMKRLDEAEPALTRSADHLARILGKNHPRTVDTRAAIERCRAGRAAAGG